MSGQRGQRGYVMVALLAAIAILLLGMGAAAPTWKYVMKNAREEELIFRGGQIADAIGRYQQRNGNALPTSLEQLVKGRFLRQAYTDPMSADGQWRFLRQGEALGAPPGRAPTGGSSAGPTPGGSAAGSPPSPGSARGAGGLPAGGAGRLGAAGSLGPIAGVASRSAEPSLRIFNGRMRYSEWHFAPGLPRALGRAPALVPQRPADGRRPAPRTGSTP